jgi:hypothetical protein
MAGPLVRDYLEINHANNAQNIREPFNINKANIAKRIYPSDLRIDVDIDAKVTTDKDFSPKRLTELQGLLQTLISTKSSHPDQLNISILPIVRAISNMLDVRPSEVIPPNSSGMPGAGAMGAADLAALGQATMPGGAGAVGMVDTPVGNVMAAS